MSESPTPGDGNAPGAVAENPWLGLASFEERHSEFFFGRSAEIAEMEQMVLRGPACLLFGRSGLGKTSLLRAGVFPRLRSKNCLPVYVRLNFASDAPPLAEQVKQELWAAVKSSRIETRPPAAGETLWEYTHREDVDFWDSRVRLITPVLVFDQFEEIFTLGRRTPKAADAVALLVEELQALINNSPPESVRLRFEAKPELVGEYDFEKRTVKILLGLREDYLPHFESLRKQFHAAGTNRMRLEPLNGLQAMEVVLKPGQGIVDEAVAQQIVGFVAHDKNQAADEPLNPERMERWVVEPALLSVVCCELNERRGKAGHPKITADLLSSGAKEEILLNFYEKAIGDMPEAVRMFVEDHLLTGTGYRDRASQDDALRVPEVTEDGLGILVSRRLLRREETNGVIWLELTHDLLTGVVQQSRNRRQQRQAEAARRKAERTAAFYKLAVAGATLIAIGALLFMLEFFHLRNVAETQRSLAAQQVQEASREDLATAEQLFDEDQWGRGIAYLGHSLSLNRANSAAAVHLWSAVVYGRHGDGRLPEFWNTISSNAASGSNASFAVLDPGGTRVLITTSGGTSIYSTTNATPIGSLPDTRAKIAVFSPNGQSLLTINSSNAAQTWDCATWTLKCTLVGVPDLPISAVFSPDSRRVAITGLDSASQGRTAGIWDPAVPTNVIMLAHQHQSWVAGAAFWGSNLVATAGGIDQSACVWDSRTGQALSRLGGEFGHRGWVMAVAFNPPGDLVVTASKDGTARIWKWRSTNLVAVLTNGGNVVTAGFNPDGSRVFTASADGTARIWDPANGLQRTDPLKHPSRVMMAAFSSSDGGAKIITRCADNTVRFWSGLDGSPLGEPLQHGRGNHLFDAEFTGPDDSKVATVGAEGFSVWNINTNHPGQLLSHNHKVWGARFSLDGHELVTACADGIARLWDVPGGQLKLELPTQGHIEPIRSASFSPDGKRVVTASETNFARVWDARSGELLWELHSRSNYIRVAEFNATGTRVVTAGVDEFASIFNLDHPEEPSPQPITLQHDGLVLWACFSPGTNADEENVLTASLDGRVRIWDATGKKVGEISHPGGSRRAVFSPDGRSVAIAWDDGTVQVANKTKESGAGQSQRWKTTSPPLSAGDCKVNAVQFSPDGQLLAAGNDDGSVVLWSLSTPGRIPGTTHLPGTIRLNDQVGDVAFTELSSHEVIFLTSSADKTARLWKIANGQMASYCEPFPHRGDVLQASFSQDGQYVATASDDGTAGIWKVPSVVTWGESMTNSIGVGARLYNIGEALTATISGFRFDTNSGQIQQMKLDERQTLGKELATNAFLDRRWRSLFLWWQTNSQQAPSIARLPWPQDP